MNPLDLEFLAACFEARQRQLEMLPLIANALGIPENQVFYHWALGRHQQSNTIPNSSWKFWFHGFECDLMNTIDRRFLRYDFGPGGRADCVTTWGVLQFIMTSEAPWKEFPILRKHLAMKEAPYDYLSGDHQKASAIWDRLEKQGCFAPANPELVAFQARYTTIRSDGIAYVVFPEGISDETQIDCSVAHRSLLTIDAEKWLQHKTV
jgi:hypothetical protein